MKVREAMSAPVKTASPDDSLRDAAKEMDRYKIGSLVVSDGEQTVGILTQRDIIKAVAEGKKPEEPVKDFMTKKMVVIDGNASIEEAGSVMLKHRVKRLPVLSGEEKLVGIVTATDILKHQDRMMEDLSGLFISRRTLLPAGG